MASLLDLLSLNIPVSPPLLKGMITLSFKVISEFREPIDITLLALFVNFFFESSNQIAECSFNGRLELIGLEG